MPTFKITPTMFCVSTKLAVLWAGLGIPFEIVVSFGNSHLIKLVKE